MIAKKSNYRKINDKVRKSFVGRVSSFNFIGLKSNIYVDLKQKIHCPGIRNYIILIYYLLLCIPYTHYLETRRKRKKCTQTLRKEKKNKKKLHILCTIMYCKLNYLSFSSSCEVIS